MTRIVYPPTGAAGTRSGRGVDDRLPEEAG